MTTYTIAPAASLTMAEPPGTMLPAQSSPPTGSGSSLVTWTGLLSSSYSIPTTDWTGYAANMQSLLSSFGGVTNFVAPGLMALGAPASYSTLAIGEPSYSAVNTTAGLIGTDQIAYEFSSPLPPGTSFLLWAPGGNYARTTNGEITSSETGPYTFTIAASLVNNWPVSMAGWTISVETPSGQPPGWTYTTNQAAGTITITAPFNASAPEFPDAVIVITSDTPVDFINVTAKTISDDTWGLAIPTTVESTSSSNLPNVVAADESILRVEPSTNSANQVASEIDAGQTTITQYQSGLIDSNNALYTTLAALVTIDAFYDATPSSTVLTSAAAATSGTSYDSAAELHNLGYSDTNVWTVLGSGWGADPTSNFYTQYNADTTGTTAGYTAFINAVYAREFGAAPTAANLQNLLADVPGTQALLNGGGHIATPIQVMAGLYGYLLYVGQTFGIGQYGTSADAFLQAAANGTVTYGPELTKEFPPSTGDVASLATGTALTNSVAPELSTSVSADPNVITVTSQDQLIDPGPGAHTVQFLPTATADTLVLHRAGVDQVSGFDPGTDILNLRSLLTGTGLDLTGNGVALPNYLTIVDQGADALLRFDPTGQGGGSTVAALQGLGSSVTGLAQLVAAGAIRVT